jgi:hypothetical protein
VYPILAAVTVALKQLSPERSIFGSVPRLHIITYNVML